MQSAAMLQPGYNFAAVGGMTFMVVFFAGTLLAWWAFGAVKWDKFVHDPLDPRARMLRFICAMVGGFLLSIVALLYVFATQALHLML